MPRQPLDGAPRLKLLRPKLFCPALPPGHPSCAEPPDRLLFQEVRTMRGPSRVVLCVTCVFFALAAGAQVTMPLAEYEALRDRANPKAEPNPVPPAPFAFETADLVISADGESARIVQTLGLTLFADGWQKVPLGEAGSFIRARFGDLDGRVNVAEDGWSLQVQGRGRH